MIKQDLITLDDQKRFFKKSKPKKEKRKPIEEIKRNSGTKRYESCKDFDKVTIEEKGRGHFAIMGKVLINHYPDGKKRTAYMKGSTTGKAGVSCEKAIHYALNPESMNIRKKATSPSLDGADKSLLEKLKRIVNKFNKRQG